MKSNKLLLYVIIMSLLISFASAWTDIYGDTCVDNSSGTGDDYWFWEGDLRVVDDDIEWANITIIVDGTKNYTFHFVDWIFDGAEDHKPQFSIQAANDEWITYSFGVDASFAGNWSMRDTPTSVDTGHTLTPNTVYDVILNINFNGDGTWNATHREGVTIKDDAGGFGADGTGQNFKSLHVMVGTGVQVNFSKLAIYEGERCSAIDTTPPVITQATYNNTGAVPGNETVWRISTSLESRTEDDTPTIIFDTDDLSNCSIGLADENYSTMTGAGGNGNPCATSETTSHSCTLNETFAIGQGNQPIFSSCAGDAGESAASTSGALNITLGFKSISGFVKDSSGNALIDATVIAVKQEPYQDPVSGQNIKRTFNTSTIADGSYFMYVFKGNYSVFSYNETSTTEADVKSYIVVE